MSTRANVKIKDSSGELWFYRHSDGYPEGTMPTLTRFLDMVINKQIRDNIVQASGWLILLGAEEYNTSLESLKKENYNSWKVGAYEPTTGEHGDIEYLYTIDLDALTIEIHDCYHKTNEVYSPVKKSSEEEE